MATLPDELQNNPTVKNLKDLPTAIKSLVDAQAYNVGALRIPRADAKPEEWTGLYRKLGMPETVEGYSVPEGALPEGVELDAGLRDWFFQAAHQAGLSTQQVHTILRAHIDRTQGIAEDAQRSYSTRLSEVEQGIRTTYGAASDRLLTLAHRAALYFADEATQQQLTEGGLRSFLSLVEPHPWMANMLVQLGQQMAEDHLITGHVEGVTSPDAALAEWAAVQGDTKHAYWDATNPGHAAAVQRISQLFQVMSGGR